MSRVDPQHWLLNDDGSYTRRAHVAQRAAESEFEATDAAADLAEELGVDLADVEGTGKDGKITVGDVRAASDG